MNTPDVPTKFYAIVTQYDMSDRQAENYRREGQEFDRGGPILYESYLNEEARDEEKVRARAASFTEQGWVRVVEIDISLPQVKL